MVVLYRRKEIIKIEFVNNIFLNKFIVFAIIRVNKFITYKVYLMIILNPRVIIEEANWFKKLFGKKYTTYLKFAVEKSNYSRRWAVTYEDLHKSFVDYKDAIKHADYIKTQIDGYITEIYCNPSPIEVAS